MKITSILSTLLLSTLALAAPLATLRYRQAQNFQTFKGAVGGIAATPIEDSGNADRPFSVKGDTFVNLSGALQRSCDQQFNACANAANGGATDFAVSDCTAQKDACDAANSPVNSSNGATSRSLWGPRGD